MKHVTDVALANWFAYHPPSDDTIVKAHEFVRDRYHDLAQHMNSLLPEGPDKTVALRAIRDAAMQANASIACAQTLHPEAGIAMGKWTVGHPTMRLNLEGVKTWEPKAAYVDVIADPDSIARLKHGIEAALTAAFGDIITAEQLAVFNETFAATVGMEPEVPDADTV